MSDTEQKKVAQEEGDDVEEVKLEEEDEQQLMGVTSAADFAAKFIAELPADVRARVRSLQTFQKEYMETYKAFQVEEAALIKKYEKLYAPIQEKRRTIIAGDRQPTEEEIKSGTPEDATADPVPTAAGGVPDFWLKVLQNNDATQEMIQERDEEALKLLTDITYTTPEDPNLGFTLEFHFAENQFFTNKVLTKTYHLVEEDFDYLLDSADGCEIDWKEGQNLTVVMKKKRQRKKTGGQVRTQVKAEPCDSFFNFFKPPKAEDMEEDDDLDQMDEMIEADMEIGQVLKERIIPQAVDWYTGAAIGPEMDDDEEEEEGDDDEEAEEDSEDEAPKKKGKKKKGGAADQMSAEQLQKAAQDCKQQ